MIFPKALLFFLKYALTGAKEAVAIRGGALSPIPSLKRAASQTSTASKPR